MIDKLQQDFEDWCKVNELRLERQRTMLGGDMGRYEFPPTQFSWEIWVEAWQASRKALVIELPQPNNDGEDSLMRMVEIALDKAGVSYK